MDFYPTTQTAQMQNDSLILETSPGNISFAEMIIQRNSKLDLTNIEGELPVTIFLSL